MEVADNCQRMEKCSQELVKVTQLSPNDRKFYAVTIPDCAIDFIEELTLMAKIVNIRKEIYSLIFLGFRKILTGVYTLSLRSLGSIYQNSHSILVVMI